MFLKPIDIDTHTKEVTPMSNSVRILAYGPKACFTRPESKIERVTYPTITINASRGICDAVYHHPGFIWCVDKIWVLHPIQLYTEMRNELDGQQRNTTFLHDPAYVIEAHPKVLPDAGVPIGTKSEYRFVRKTVGIFNRRLRRGQQYEQPHLGLRECEAFLEPIDGKMPKSCHDGSGKIDLGLMVYQIDYDNPGAPSSYIHLTMEDGLIDVARAVAEGKVVR